MPFVPGFRPGVSGFHFENSKDVFGHTPLLTIPVGPVTVPIGDAANGLCGGMAFAACDYFLIGSPPAPLDGVPGTTFDYLVRRLFDSFNLASVPPGPARYMALMNPALPDHETDASRAGLAPRGRAWVMINIEWPKIRRDLDEGTLCPLGLIRIKSLNPFEMGTNHQVLAYGYDLTGTQLVLHVYDPNHPGEDVRISLDIGDPEHTTAVTQSTGEDVFCFFRTDYRFAQPPPVDQGPPLPGDEVPWLEDELPAGAAPDEQAQEWWWTSFFMPRSGRAAHVSLLASGRHEHAFSGATKTLTVDSGDVLFTYIRLDTAKPPREVMLQWHDGTWEHRAFWGEDLIAIGSAGTASRRRIGDLPAVGKWARLDVPAAAVGLEGSLVDGISFTLYDGMAAWDRAGKIGSALTGSDRLVTGARKGRGRRITALCSPGAAWSPRPVAQAIADLRRGDCRYLVAGAGGRKSEIIVVSGPTGPYLRTKPDRASVNKLARLPPCD